MVDIDKYEQIFLDFKIKEVLLTDEQINQRTIELMKSDVVELQWINDDIPKYISKLEGLINEVENIVDKIE